MTRDIERDYMDEVGHEPPVDDSEDAWQWDYRGTPEERAALLERLAADDEPAPEQDSLF